MLEYTVLKHEVVYLSAKKDQIGAKIYEISLKWPKKKTFIESAYKLLLFTKRSKPEIRLVWNLIIEHNLQWFFDFQLSVTEIQKNRLNKISNSIQQIFNNLLHQDQPQDESPQVENP